MSLNGFIYEICPPGVTFFLIFKYYTHEFTGDQASISGFF